LSDNKRLIAGEPLHPVHTATTVRVRNGEVQLFDGPFAETKELLAGFYLVDAKDLSGQGRAKSADCCPRCCPRRLFAISLMMRPTIWPAWITEAARRRVRVMAAGNPFGLLLSLTKAVTGDNAASRSQSADHAVGSVVSRRHAELGWVSCSGSVLGQGSK
jgi:hypothetical protein